MRPYERTGPERAREVARGFLPWLKRIWRESRTRKEARKNATQAKFEKNAASREAQK